MRWCVSGLACALLSVGGHVTGWADVVRLSTGRDLEGIVTRETTAAVQVKVGWESYIVLGRDSVVAIEPGNEAEHQRLLEAWRGEFLETQQRQRERLEFERAQRARGFVTYQGQWLSQEAFAQIKEAQAQEVERRQREAEAKRLEQKLQALQEENLRLQRVLVQQELSLARTCLIVHQGPFDPVVVEQILPGRFEDEQGNLIRVRRHDGHQFFVSPDGTHVDVASHGDHLAFTDEHDLHHDLGRVGHPGRTSQGMGR